MKRFMALGVALGLLAVVQAVSIQASPYGLLKLEGAVALEDLPAGDSSVSIASTDSSGKKGHHRSQHQHKSKQHHAKSHDGDAYTGPSHHEDDYQKHRPHDDKANYEPHDLYQHDSTPQESYSHDSYESHAPEDSYPHDSHDSYHDESYYTPYGDPYWGPRYRAKGELIACVKYAVDLFDSEDVSTWQGAGEALAECLKEFFHGCSDVPGLDLELTSTLPFILFVNGLETLVNGAGSMQAAAAVLNFYLIGGDPDNTDLYLGDNSCPAKLVALLQSGAKHSRNTAVISSLAKVVIHIFTESHKTRSALEPCKADVPAVLLALISTYCPERGTLYNAFTGTTSVCEFNKDVLYENSAGALLGGSIITGLLLSKNPKLMHFGFQLAFDVNLLALAGTYTSNFTYCPQDLQDFLDQFPDYSGPLGTMKVKGISAPSDAAKRVLCASIAAVNGGEIFEAHESEGDGENILWQGAANVYNAIFKTIKAIQDDNTMVITYDPYTDKQTTYTTPKIPQKEIDGLCAVSKAVYSFQPNFNNKITVVVPAATDPAEEDSSPCFTSDVPIDAVPNGVPAKRFEGLKRGHTLNKDGNSAAAAVCGWNARFTCPPPPVVIPPPAAK